MKQHILWVIAILVLVGAGYMIYDRTDIFDDVKQAQQGRSVLAVVDGESITRAELEGYLQQLMPGYEDAAGSEELKEVEGQILEQIIDERLLIAEAKRQGISVSDEELDEQFDSVVEEVGGMEMLERELADVGMDVQEVRDSFARHMLLDRYFDRIKAEHDIAASQEEVEEAYASDVAGQDIDIPLEDVEDEIRSQLEQQKLVEVLPSILEELRENADIEVRI